LCCIRRNSSRRCTSASSVSSSRRFLCFSPKRSKIHRSLALTPTRYGGAWYAITQYTAENSDQSKIEEIVKFSIPHLSRFQSFLPPNKKQRLSPRLSCDAPSDASQKASFFNSAEESGNKRLLCTQNPNSGNPEAGAAARKIYSRLTTSNNTYNASGNCFTDRFCQSKYMVK